MALSGGRRIALFASLGVVAAAVVTALVVLAVSLVTQFVEWRQAADRYEAAIVVQDAAIDAFETATLALESANHSLVARAGLVEQLRERGGVVVPSGAATALFEAHEASSLEPLTVATVELSARPDDLVSLSAKEVDEATSSLERETTRLESATRESLGFVDTAQEATASFDAELDAFVEAVSAHGTSLLSERQDASADALASLQAATAALPGLAAESLGTALDTWAAAADEVLRTSNAKRIDDPNSVVVVVNKVRPLQPQNYVPKLVRVDVPFISTPLLRAEAAGPLVEMFAAFTSETGERLRLQNSYRSFATQTNTYNYHVSTKGQAQADRGSARPGHSEHQTGLALDVNGVGYGCSIQQCFGEMVHGKWLEQNAWRFGWVIRYPKGYEHVTGYDWEPWHLRYVGVDVSTAMHEGGIATLEEYFELAPAPTY